MAKHIAIGQKIIPIDSIGDITDERPRHLAIRIHRKSRNYSPVVIPYDNEAELESDWKKLHKLFCEN